MTKVGSKGSIGFCLLPVVVLGSGCMMVRAGRLPPVSPWPPTAGSAKKSIAVLVRAKSVVNGKDVEPPARVSDMWREQTLVAYRDSALFSDVRADGSSDLRAEVSIQERGDVNMAMAFLTGLTLYLIPSSATSDLTMRTEVRDAEGNSLGSFEKSETLTFWQELFLVFAMPAHFPPTVAKTTITDLGRSTVAEAHARGVF